MKELKPSTKLDGTPEENERAIQRIIYSLSEEEKAESMSDKYAYLKINFSMIKYLVLFG